MTASPLRQSAPRRFAVALAKFAFLLWIASGFPVSAETPNDQSATALTAPTAPKWDLAALSKAPTTYPAEPLRAEGEKGIFFEALPYHGNPTRVFAWLGLPKVAPGQKVPGMVLVHGGGGTAYEEWVRLWVSRGYAAIAIDACGCIPLHVADPKKWQRHDLGGPAGWGGWNQLKEAATDQWTYHAVADAILAHSLLRSLPEVDSDRTGLTGISWGGYLTCIIASIDDRFKFAAPVYGCGFTNEHGFANKIAEAGPELGARWMEWWDPSVYLPAAKMPMLWVSGSNDFAYTLNALQKSYRLPAGPRTLCIRLRMPHNQSAGAAPQEIQVFADQILNHSGAPLAKAVEQGREGKKVWAKFESVTPLTKVELNYTKDTGRWQDRNWETVTLDSPANGKAEAELPESARVYYFNATDARGCVVSAEHVEVQPQP